MIKCPSESELTFVCRRDVDKASMRKREKRTEIYCASVVSTCTKYFISLATAIDDGDNFHILTSLSFKCKCSRH